MKTNLPNNLSTAVLTFLMLASSEQASAQTKASNAEGALPAAPPQALYGFSGPEDIEVLPDQRHLVVSSFPADFAHPLAPGLMLMDTAGGATHPLKITPAFESGWGDESCRTAPAAWGTHGLHISARADGRTSLLAVNHTGREAVEFLEIVKINDGYEALWRGCVQSPHGLLNDVAATEGGGFIASVMMAKSLPARKDALDVMKSGEITGYLAQWRSGSGLHRLPGTEAAMNNGVQLSRDGRYVFFNAWSGKQIIKYDRKREQVVQRADMDFFPDNLSFREDGSLLSAGTDELDSWKACVIARATFCDTASTVAVIDPISLKATLLYRVAPGVQTGASIAVQLRDTLYIGSAMGDRLLKIDLPQLAGRR